MWNAMRTLLICVLTLAGTAAAQEVSPAPPMAVPSL